MAEVSPAEVPEATQEPKERACLPKRMKLDESGPNLRHIKEAERKAERDRKEASKHAEKLRKEAERKAEKERKDNERKAEKERKEQERKAEKDRKEKVRLAEKERKEAEKQAEKERKEREKKAERLLKETEKQAEKERKLKAQPPINLFFKKSDTPELSVMSSTSSGPGSDQSETDYKKHILPFHVKIDGELYSSVCNYEPKSPSEYKMDPFEWLQYQAQHQISTGKSTITSREFQQSLALAQESSQVSSLLSQIRIRRLQFSHLSTRHIEDPNASVNVEFRPPYVGSTKDIDLVNRKLLAQDPFRTDLDSTMAYEYDSEAEWDPEEGEDLNEDDDIESDEEMEDNEELKEFFTSDDDDSSNKRPRIVGPLTPIIVWGRNSDLDPFKIVVNSTIDPYKPIMLPTTEQTASEKSQKEQSEDTIESLVTSLATKLDASALKTALMSHINSTGTKTLIVELLKQQFPNALDKEIRQLFDMCMERVGKKRAEKRWVLTPAASTYFKPPL